MINIIEAIALGIIQGITEWLPISSSGHLVLAQKFMGIEVPVAFDLMLHLATLLVLLVIYWPDICKVTKAVIQRKFYTEEGKLGILLLWATIPIAVIGLIFRQKIEAAFSSTLFVGFALIFTAVLLIFSERNNLKLKLNYKNSIIIGAMQAVALFPGVSRSGSTISTAMILGVDKKTAAKFSFMLFIPAVLGATILQLGALKDMTVPISSLIVGMLSAFLVGYFSLRWLLKLIMQKKFHYFAYYCFIVGAMVIVFSLV